MLLMMNISIMKMNLPTILFVINLMMMETQREIHFLVI